MNPSRSSSIQDAIKNPPFFLRRFAHPWMATAMYTPIAFLLAYLSYYSQPRSALMIISLILAGVFVWTFLEYVLHRFVFHLTEVKEPWRTLASGLHMAHHRDVEVQDLIVAPPFVSFIYAAIIYLLFSLITWSFSAGAWMGVGLIIGYVVYEWTHYAAHHYSFKSSFLKYLKQYHLLHHFKYPAKVYGITSPFWDYLFGTYTSLNPKKN